MTVHNAEIIAEVHWDATWTYIGQTNLPNYFATNYYTTKWCNNCPHNAMYEMDIISLMPTWPLRLYKCGKCVGYTNDQIIELKRVICHVFELLRNKIDIDCAIIVMKYYVSNSIGYIVMKEPKLWPSGIFINQ